MPESHTQAETVLLPLGDLSWGAQRMHLFDGPSSQ